LFGAYQVIGGHMTVGQTIAVNTWLLMSMSPINILASQYMFMHQILGSVQRVLDILDIPIESDDINRTESLQNRKPTIELSNVNFQYGDTLEPVLQGVDLKIGSGERIALIGCSGAGKSTIVSLLLGMYKPTSGEIKVCGIDISKVRLDSLRSYIAVVSQDVLLMNSTIIENIRYGDSTATEADVQKAAKAAGAADFIEALPLGYYTVIGERGTTLSGGQRQRIAIAQAFLRNAPILILDEATSAIDLETEYIIHESLKTLTIGKTVILISHRQSVLQNVDRIAILENGQIKSTYTPSQFIQDELSNVLTLESS
jgi:subfamily B ATP-binding cassette protein MsbA